MKDHLRRVSWKVLEAMNVRFQSLWFASLPPLYVDHIFPVLLLVLTIDRFMRPLMNGVMGFTNGKGIFGQRHTRMSIMVMTCFFGTSRARNPFIFIAWWPTYTNRLRTSLLPRFYWELNMDLDMVRKTPIPLTRLLRLPCHGSISMKLMDSHFWNLCFISAFSISCLCSWIISCFHVLFCLCLSDWLCSLFNQPFLTMLALYLHTVFNILMKFALIL